MEYLKSCHSKKKCHPGETNCPTHSSPYSGSPKFLQLEKLQLECLHFYLPHILRASLVAQLEKNPPAMRETWIQSLGWEDPLEKRKATHWRILWPGEFHGVIKSQT